MAKKLIFISRQLIPWEVFAAPKNIVQTCSSTSRNSAVKKVDKDLETVI